MLGLVIIPHRFSFCMNPSTGNVALNAAEWHLRRSQSYQDCEGREVRSRTVPHLQNKTPSRAIVIAASPQRTLPRERFSPMARSGANQCPLGCRLLGDKPTRSTQSELFAF